MIEVKQNKSMESQTTALSENQSKEQENVQLNAISVVQDQASGDDTNSLAMDSSEDTPNVEVVASAKDAGEVLYAGAVEVKANGETVHEVVSNESSKKAHKKKDNKEDKDYTPIYSNEEKTRLEQITKICEEEIERVILDDRYNSIPYGNDSNCLINLKTAHKNGIDFCTPVLNRVHGTDLDKTGSSIMTNGAQHILLVMTKRMADACGIDVARFSNDPKSGVAANQEDLVFLDGNGRMKFLLDFPEDKWPDVFATFICKDKANYFNPSVAMSEINTQVAVWKTPDYIQKRVFEEGKTSHEGWTRIIGLQRKGYLYQSACQLMTLKTDRIKKSEVVSGDQQKIFENYPCALKIYEALKKKFGEGDDKTLKTKAFTAEVSCLWGKLKNASGNATATDQFLDFIEGLSEDTVKQIKNVKKDNKNPISKDDQRKAILQQEFFMYVGKKQIKLS